jgi:hypothetical protein
MAQINTNNLVSSAKVYPSNQYAEFTTMFRIPFKETPYEEVFSGCENRYKRILEAWAPVCIIALESRMDSCVSMLFRNKSRVLVSNPSEVIFKKNNGNLHTFRYASFAAMEELLGYFQKQLWNISTPNVVQARQLLKALYWVSEEDRKDHGGFGFGELVSCIEEFTFELK